MAALVAGVAVGTIGSFLTSAPLVFGGVVLVMLVVATVVSLAVRTPELVVSRRFAPDRAVAGWSVVETMTIRRREPGGSVTLRVRDTLSWRTMATDESVVATLERGASVEAAFEHDDLPRGRHRVGPARIEVIEAFGLAQRLVTVPGRGELVVVPEVVSVGRGRESRSLGEGSRQRRDHSAAGGQDDPITREYRRGDPMRRVHWKASARQGELMVRQEEQHGLPSARVVLPVRSENWRDAHPALGSGEPVSDGFEWAVSQAASIALEYGMAGSQTRVVSLTGGTVALHDPSMTPVFLDHLADLRLDDAAEIDERTPEPSPREPVIAVVSSLSRLDLDLLSQARGPGVPGVALVVHLDAHPLTPDDRSVDSPTAVASLLRESGWQVVEADSTADRAEVLATRGVLGG
ncbi:hypothetical protein AS850_09595 [Frondihabitans sp. 762G35]|uniref:DUF58 domain-containing protein n=1 Tax=Frondihabitans sp. 762G35 TaxID=1446794 RepID=UPI000D224771|nr:DUF58 domain-containing protein [Frondihabitans sp. 762G35]ARC57328.1 hypothetical protein AS850_09595 [Frondihabitans sp. 762G35]